MQKQTQLTKREVVLLFIAGILLISYTSFNYLISPMMDKYRIAVKENDKLQWKNQEALIYPETIESNKKIIAKVKDDLFSKSTIFEDKADSLKVDEEITSLLQTNNISPISVQIEDGIKVENDKIVNSTENSNDNQDANIDKKEVSLPAVYKFKVKVQAIGNLENAKRVFETVSNSTDRKITKFEVIENEKTILNFTFIVFVRDSFELED
ncbi:MAG: hypothetical protein K0R71_245 [Bacillales bacterium]|jgi:hypothetical protein|nr:hypothetical protein [Bacillales bacterium]